MAVYAAQGLTATKIVGAQLEALANVKKDLDKFKYEEARELLLQVISELNKADSKLAEIL